MSSGVDGAQCSSEGEFGQGLWNETLWQSFNGSSCSISDSFGGVSDILKYDVGYASTDNDCSMALSSYRDLTGFTCNCTGDYSFLKSGARPGTVLTISQTIYYLIMVVVAPLIGAISDVTPHRKRLWLIFASIFSVSIALMAIIGQTNVWAVSLLFATLASPAYDIMCIPIMAYLPELHYKEVERAKYTGMAQAANYVAQFIFGILMSMVSVTFYTTIGSIGVAQISCIICSIWIFTFMRQSYKRMDTRPAGHAKSENDSLMAAAFGSLWKTTKLLYNEHPMAARYLLTNVFGATGIIVNIGLLTTYLVVQLEMGGTQIVAVYLLVMTTGCVLFCFCFIFLFVVAAAVVFF
jgi:MFS-type transporter involved in bile tolerance (Atg22 family)